MDSICRISPFASVLDKMGLQAFVIGVFLQTERADLRFPGHDDFLPYIRTLSCELCGFSCVVGSELGETGGPGQ